MMEDVAGQWTKGGTIEHMLIFNIGMLRHGGLE